MSVTNLVTDNNYYTYLDIMDILNRLKNIYKLIAKISFWKYVMAIFILSYLIRIPFLMLTYFSDDITSAKPDAFRLGVVFVSFIVPFIETLLCQYLPIYIIRCKISSKKSIQIISSAILFALGHQYSLDYIIVMFLVGLVYAFGFVARYDERGFESAYFGIAIAHCLNNAVAMVLVSYGM